MVDAIVSYAVQKLGDFLIEKVVFRLNIRDDVEWLQKELRYMHSFLKHAEEKQSKDHLLQQWVSDIADLARDTVDMLDEISIIVGTNEYSEHGIVDRVKRYACICTKEVNLYGIGNDIKSLRQRVLELSRLRDTYGITSISAGEEPSNSGPNNRSIMKIIRRTTCYADEENFVGFEDVSKILLRELLIDIDSRRVISIYGMGGLGKTTLARRLYNSYDIQSHFACRAWVCVSQEYSIQDLLRTIIKSFKRGCNKEDLERLERMNEDDLECHLRESLKEQRYIVVIDDVWSKEAWQSLKRAFPDCRNGSRVIITTGKKEVAERVDDKCFIHHLRFLMPEESWDLFIKKIYCEDGHANWFTPAMQGIGKEMIGKCGGLPLAIIVLGGLLSNKREPEEWHKVKEQLWQHMKKDSIDIYHLLSLSYNDLSSELKQCYLYVGIFPEDYVFNAQKLTWLWMAEGFIPQGNKMEDFAEDYLNELVNRSLIQVVDRFWGNIEACTIHDLLRDLVVEKAMEVNFFDIYDPRVYISPPSRRRLAIHTQIGKFFTVGLSNPKLRSLVFFNPDFEHPDIANLTTICRKLKYLCVLDLKNVFFGPSFGYQRLPDAIGDLVHLKLLGLRSTNFSELPQTIGNLKSLQTLEISSSHPCRVPMEISKLINLRHLYMHRPEGMLQIDTLTNLRTLQVIIMINE